MSHFLPPSLRLLLELEDGGGGSLREGGVVRLGVRLEHLERLALDHHAGQTARGGRPRGRGSRSGSGEPWYRSTC